MADDRLEQALANLRYCICAVGFSTTNGSFIDSSSNSSSSGGGGDIVLGRIDDADTSTTTSGYGVSYWRPTIASSSSAAAATTYGDAGNATAAASICSDATMWIGVAGQSGNAAFRRIEELLTTRIAVAVCVFGLIGNVGNLVVLLPQGRHCSMGRIERFAYCGLVALTVSDGLFCLSVVPQSFVERDPLVERRSDFSLLYAVYGNALVNVFSMASTWLTVTLAVGRYLAICHPFRAREVIGSTVAKRAIFVVYAACVVFNVPRFMTYGIEQIHCADDDDDDESSSSTSVFFQWPGETHVKRRPELERVYMWLYFAFGIGVPFVCLVFSNVFLVRALRVACVRLQSIRAVDVVSLHQYRPITLTLVALVIMHIVLVSPAEFVLFLRQLVVWTGLPVRFSPAAAAACFGHLQGCRRAYLSCPIKKLF